MKIENFTERDQNAQAEAVLAMLPAFGMPDNAYISPDDEDGEPGNYEKYKCDLALFEFDNCREQGYMLLDRTSGLCMIWYEHRNSDTICIASMRTPEDKVDAAAFFAYLDEHKPDADKWNMYDVGFSWGQIGEAAEYIYNKFNEEY